jgi:hypothetical protein
MDRKSFFAKCPIFDDSQRNLCGSNQEQQSLIAAVREKRRLMPVLCLRPYNCEHAPDTCIAVDNEPVALLNTIRLATKALMPNLTAQSE